MDLHKLKTFVIVSRLGSITKASRLLDYAQSSISAQVLSLENELETKLFERIGNKICLTEEGKKFLGYSEQILKLADEARESVNGNTVPRGILTIGASESLCIFRLPALLQQYRKKYPEVRLILKLGKCCDVHSWIQKKIIDVAFLLDTQIINSNLIVETLSHEQVVLIAGNDHHLLKKKSCVPSDFSGEDLILIEEEGCCYRVIFERQLAEAGVQLGSVQEFGSVETIKKCVISGLGISILPKMAVELEISNGQLSDLNWNGGDFNIQSQIIYHKDKWLSAALIALIKLTKDLYLCQT